MPLVPSTAISASIPAGESPLVSVFMAVRNEARCLELCLDGFAGQTYPRDRFELVIAVSGDDGTREIVGQYTKNHGMCVRSIENPHGGIAQGLNLALAASRGDILALYIGHAVPEPTYLESLVRTLGQNGIDYVGGMVVPTARVEDPDEEAIALAMRQRFTVGRNSFTSDRPHRTRASHWMAVKREWAERIGPFNETLPRGEDCDWYARLAEAGANGWYDPVIRSRYFVRRDLRSFFKTSVLNAYHRIHVAVRTGHGLTLRHAVPGIVAILAIAGLSFSWSRGVVLCGGLLYGLILGWSAWRAGKDRPTLVPRIALAILLHHTGHVIGLVVGVFRFGPQNLHLEESS